MAETHSEFYTADVGGVHTWRVESHTARTWKVARDITHGHTWRRVVRMADIGQTYFVTPLAALGDVARRERNEIRILKDRLQKKRTSLGMIESEMRKWPGGSELVALESAPSSDAVARAESSQAEPSTREKASFVPSPSSQE
jgi:hypothetical protein